MSFPKFVDSVKRFLTHYLDMSQDREEEAASVEAIRAGVSLRVLRFLFWYSRYLSLRWD